MERNTYAIMGATGHVGSILAEELLKKGHKVHAIGRDKNKLQKLKEKGAEVFVCACDNATALTEALKGCKAVFSILPPGYTETDLGAFQDKVGEAIKQAISKSKIQYVLNLSSIGASLAEGTGAIKGLHRHEKRLNTLANVNVLHLRPGFFMENFLVFIPLIKSKGIIGSHLNSDLSIPMVATHDIALKAAEFLSSLEFSGQSIFEFAGPKEITLKSATEALGKAVGKTDIKYIPFGYSDAEKGMLSFGMKPDVVRQLLEMDEAFNSKKIDLTQQMTPEHRGKTTIEEYSKAFAKAYQAASQLATAHH